MSTTCLTCPPTIFTILNCAVQLCEPIKAYLQQAEEEFRAAKEEQRHAVWDDRMRATQTQSAFGIRVT